MGTPQGPPVLYDKDAAAKVLGVSVSWLDKQVAAGTVPFTKLGRLVRFTDDHLREIVARGEHRSAS